MGFDNAHWREIEADDGPLVLDWAALMRALGLSGRELQIIRALISEQKDDAIAAALGISRHTVRTHMGRLFRKLSVSSRTGLVVRVMKWDRENR